MRADATGESARVSELRAIVRRTPWLFELLEIVRAAGPPEAYVAAGAVRNTVWNCLTGRPSSGPHGDVDVVYWSVAEAAQASDEHRSRLLARRSDVDWEVTNQATVHLWHSRARGVVVAPHRTVAEGLATWPESATAVGVRSLASGGVDVIAPFGLADLFALRVRHNPVVADADAFWSRVRDKRWLERWPELRVEGAPPSIGFG